MATPSSILAWEIPWTEEPGGLQSKESDTTEQLTLHTSHFTSSCGQDKVTKQYFSDSTSVLLGSRTYCILLRVWGSPRTGSLVCPHPAPGAPSQYHPGSLPALLWYRS